MRLESKEKILHLLPAQLFFLLFGTHFLLTREVTGLRSRDAGHVLAISEEMEVSASSVILAMGIEYRRLHVPVLDRFLNSGVFYGSSPADSQPFAGQRVVIVGAGNSAGQAAIHLSRYAEHVTIICRGRGLASSMSQYLRDELDARGNVTVRFGTEVVDAAGEQSLERLALRGESGSEWVSAQALFVLIGGHPRADWLPPSLLRDEGGYTDMVAGLVERDAQGFILTGRDLMIDGRPPRGWPLVRDPFLFETSVPGIFAVGDVRSRSVKRVAAAVGEGSVVVHQVHRYLESLTAQVAFAER